MLEHGFVETPRLRIRQFAADDAAKLVALLSDDAVARHVGDGTALSPEDAILWVERSRANLQRFGYGTGAVVERASDQLIGWAGFARPAEGPEQIIYGLSVSHWRRGIGSEIVQALIAFAERRQIPTVSATVDPANLRSIALLQRYGFRIIEKAHRGDERSDLYMLDVRK